MNLPTTTPNDRDLAWYVRECEWLDDRNKVLERENAALRADKERLDWMASADYWADIAVYRTPKGLRAAIDAARKEAQS